MVEFFGPDAANVTKQFLGDEGTQFDWRVRRERDHPRVGEERRRSAGRESVSCARRREICATWVGRGKAQELSMNGRENCETGRETCSSGRRGAARNGSRSPASSPKISLCWCLFPRPLNTCEGNTSGASERRLLPRGEGVDGIMGLEGGRVGRGVPVRGWSTSHKNTQRATTRRSLPTGLPSRVQQKKSTGGNVNKKRANFHAMSGFSVFRQPQRHVSVC